MRIRFIVLVVAAAAVALLSPGRAAAHALRLVVKVPPDAPDITIEAAFSDDTPAEGATVTITDATGKMIAEGKTSEKGVYTVAKPAPGNYTAVVESVGHRDEVAFEVAGSGGEYSGWRPNQAVGMTAGVGGLLAASAGFWWLRRRK